MMLLRDRMACCYPMSNKIKLMGINSLVSVRCDFNPLRPRDGIWIHRLRSILAQVMDCCLTAPSHYQPWYPLCWMHRSLSQITSLMIVYSAVNSDTDQRKHQSSASLAFVGGNSPVTSEFPTQRASYVENVSIWWHHRVSFEKWCHLWTYYYVFYMSTTLAYCHSVRSLQFICLVPLCYSDVTWASWQLKLLATLFIQKHV